LADEEFRRVELQLCETALDAHAGLWHLTAAS
jgi:hypothetical protein